MRPSGEPSPDAAGPADRAHIYFNGVDIFSLGDKAGKISIRSRSLPLVKRLNHLYREDRPPQLAVVATSANSARIEADGKTVIDVLPGDVLPSSQADAMATARTWAGALQRGLESKKAARR